MKRIFILVIMIIAGGMLLKNAGMFDQAENPNTTPETQTEEIINEETNTEENQNNSEEIINKEINNTEKETTSETIPAEVLTPSTPIENNSEEIEKPGVQNPNIDIDEMVYDQITKVYLYEWNIDIHNATLAPGKVQFEVYNNGRRSHKFGILGVQDFGKIKPGEKRVFATTLNEGEFSIYSSIEVDQEQGMIENFTVTR